MSALTCSIVSIPSATTVICRSRARRARVSTMVAVDPSSVIVSIKNLSILIVLAPSPFNWDRPLCPTPTSSIATLKPSSRSSFTTENGIGAQPEDRLIERLDLASGQPSIDIGHRAFQPRRCPRQEQAEDRSQSQGDQDRRPIGFAVPLLQGAAFDTNPDMERVAGGSLVEVDGLREFGGMLRPEPYNVGAVVQLERNFAVGAQFLGHDIEHVGSLQQYYQAVLNAERALHTEDPAEKERALVEYLNLLELYAALHRANSFSGISKELVGDHLIDALVELELANQWSATIEEAITSERALRELREFMTAKRSIINART